MQNYLYRFIVKLLLKMYTRNTYKSIRLLSSINQKHPIFKKVSTIKIG